MAEGDNPVEDCIPMEIHNHDAPVTKKLRANGSTNGATKKRLLPEKTRLALALRDQRNGRRPSRATTAKAFGISTTYLKVAEGLDEVQAEAVRNGERPLLIPRKSNRVRSAQQLSWQARAEALVNEVGNTRLFDWVRWRRAMDFPSHRDTGNGE
jgi:hypothetical protein